MWTVRSKPLECRRSLWVETTLLFLQIFTIVFFIIFVSIQNRLVLCLPFRCHFLSVSWGTFWTLVDCSSHSILTGKLTKQIRSTKTLEQGQEHSLLPERLKSSRLTLDKGIFSVKQVMNLIGCPSEPKSCLGIRFLNSIGYLYSPEWRHCSTDEEGRCFLIIVQSRCH